MDRLSAVALLIASSFLALGCADDTVVTTGQIETQVNEVLLEAGAFSEFQTFSVVTEDVADLPPGDLEPDQEVFNRKVNDLIIKYMQEEPVCLEYIEPQDAEDNPPDLWAANGLGQTNEGGFYYVCCGGWWWGYWGWYWDPCAYWCPQYVEYDVGSLLVPVGLPLSSGEPPVAVFAGLAQSVQGTGPDVDTKLDEAVRLIFQQWPEKRQCSGQ